jgi:hypothetical protein
VKENYLGENLRFEAAIKQTLKCEADEYNMLKFSFFFIEHSMRFWKNCSYIFSELTDNL